MPKGNQLISDIHFKRMNQSLFQGYQCVNRVTLSLNHRRLSGMMCLVKQGIFANMTAEFHGEEAVGVITSNASLWSEIIDI